VVWNFGATLVFKMTPSLGLMPDEMLEEIANALEQDTSWSGQ